MNDMRTLAEIRDVNIARIIAIVEEEPFSAIFEYGEVGDLPGFLKNRDCGAPIRWDSITIRSEISFIFSIALIFILVINAR